MIDTSNVVPFTNNISPFPFSNEDSIPAVNAPSAYQPPEYNIDLLNNMCFNPIDLNFVEQSSVITDDNEYEIAHWDKVNSHQSSYFSQSSFISETTPLKDTKSQQLSFLHLNARSLNKHFTEISAFIHGLQYPFSVLGFSECWLNSKTESLFELSGYKMFSLQRPGRQGGGLALYVTSDIADCYLREDLCYLQDSGCCECIFVEIKLKDMSYLIGLVYRPPGQDVNDFNSHLISILNVCQKEKKKIAIIGDFNIDLFKTEYHSPSKAFLDIMKSNYCLPQITKPTRVQSRSATLIDNIFTNCFEDQLLSGIILTDITDHFPIFHIMQTNFKKARYRTNDSLPLVHCS